MTGEVRFEAMGTWAHVVVVGGPAGLVGWARRRVDDLERRWSRFLPDSEVSRLNGEGGGGTGVVSGETAWLLERARAAHDLTGGLFDATVLPAVVAAGYGRSFELGPVATQAAPGFDPGGIGKGCAADLVVAELLSRGALGACVNLGGDLRVEGTPPGGPPWVIDVEDPFGGPPVATLGLTRGAIATSSRRKRAWTLDGVARHHLIDPATGEPAETDAAAATVIAAEAWQAEALATAAVVAGIGRGLELISTSGAAGLLIDADGAQHRTASLAAFLG